MRIFTVTSIEASTLYRGSDIHDPSRVATADAAFRTEQLSGLNHVDAGDDALLNKEDGDLDLLPDRIRREKGSRIRRVGSILALSVFWPTVQGMQSW
jgi:hypothetical protein